MRNILAVVTVAALLAGAGCSGRKPQSLPPAPPTDRSSGDYGGPPEGAATVTPGSQADFVSRAGSDTVHFGTDRYDLKPGEAAILDAQARWLAQYPSIHVTIEGHCDERGTREYNLALGERRANAVKNYLANRGVSPSRMSVISYGKERPIAMGSDEDAWAQNRRAVTVLLNGLAE